MKDQIRDADPVRIRKERDLYLHLLELGTKNQIAPLLADALSLVVEATGAQQGYLEIQDERDPDKPQWSIARGFSEREIADIRATLSTGIMAEAMATGHTVRTPSALDDQRFFGRPSVMKNRIEAVLCAPIEAGDTHGVLYLEGRRGFGPFTDEDVTLVEAFARHVTPFVTRVVDLERQWRTADPTQPVRKGLRVEGLVGCSRALAEILRNVALVAARDVPVLITGPSGTGKTALARAIHDSGPRAERPFIELNCAAIPEELAESELFGALPGAHSTAHRRIPGKVAGADGGTLFLDEIAELSLKVQAKLLQLLQSKTYFPLGGVEAMSADIRIIAATNSNLAARVTERRFREDLFYRLNVLPIRMPALRERMEDIPLLARHFCRLFSRGDATELSLSAGGLQSLLEAEWPGNIRQLANVIQAGVIRAQHEGATEVARLHLFPDHPPEAAASEVDYHEATRGFQRTLLAEALAQTDWNVSEAARRLGLARSTMNLLIRNHRLRRDAP